MVESVTPSRPIAESLFVAVRDLRASHTIGAAREAVRTTTLALEFHLDTMARKLSDDARAIDPGLHDRALSVETRLRAVLEDCWAFQHLGPDASFDAVAAASLAKQIERVATSEVDLVFAELNALTAVD
jgi:hypothetical protein